MTESMSEDIGGPSIAIEFIQQSFGALEAYVERRAVRIIRHGSRAGKEPYEIPTREDASQCCEAIEWGLGALRKTPYSLRLAARYFKLKEQFDTMDKMGN